MAGAMTTTTFDVAAVTGARFLGSWEPGTPEWHAARRDAVGGSEVAAILGISPYDSYFSLWHRKAGNAAPQSENEQMRWGKLLEDVVCQEFAARHPELVMVGAGTYAHPDRQWQIANPDRLARNIDTGEVVVVEAKTSRDSLGFGEEGTDQVPVNYRAQVMHYLDVFGLTTAYLPVLIAGSDYAEYVLRYDPADAKTGRDAAERFVTSLRNGDLPSVDGHTATLQVVREMHPNIDDVAIELPVSVARSYQLACLAYDDAEEAKRLATSQVLAHMGRARRATCLGERIALRVPGRGDNPPFLRPARTRMEFT